MKRKDRQMSYAESLELLEREQYGVMSTADSEGHPYGVPISYAFINGSVYVHCGRGGHKVDNIRSNNKVSFTVVGAVSPVFDGNFSTYYESVIVFGHIEETEDPAEKHAVLMSLIKKYLPTHLSEAEAYIRKLFDAVRVYRIIPCKISGKANKKRSS